jgi:hypothetical protein
LAAFGEMDLEKQRAKEGGREEVSSFVCLDRENKGKKKRGG